MYIKGGNNPQTLAHVDLRGRVQARSASLSEQEQGALDGDAFNINTSTLTLTNAVEAGILYLKNNGTRDLSIKRVFFSVAASSGGTGEIYARLVANPTGGTLISAATELDTHNFNVGSNKIIEADVYVGGTGSTLTGGTDLAEFLLPTDSQRYSIAFESIVIPQGASVALTFQAPAGNTSLKIQAGINAYKQIVQ